MGLEFYLSIVSSVVLGILAWLISRSIGQVDDNLKTVWDSIDDLRESEGNHCERIAVIESRIRHL